MADSYTRRQFAWLDQVAADPTVSASAFVLAYRISKFFNRETGTAWPAQPRLAAAMRMDVRSIRSLIDQLQATGHLEVIASHGRGHSCRYRPVVISTPPTSTPGAIEGPDILVAVDQPEPASDAAAPMAEPEDGHLFPIATVPKVAPKPAPRPPKEDHLTDDFDSWWRQYPCKKSKGRAAKAYAVARKSGATADELKAAVMRYAAVRIDQDPQYTKHPATWLNDKCWLDEVEHRPLGDRPLSQFQRPAPLSHMEIAIAGRSRRDE